MRAWNMRAWKHGNIRNMKHGAWTYELMDMSIKKHGMKHGTWYEHEHKAYETWNMKLWKLMETWA
jgi:hypothetical protein